MKTWTRAALVGAACVAAASIGASSWLRRLDGGAFDRPRLQAVVANVEALGMLPGEERDLRLDDLAKPASLRARRPGEGEERGASAGNVSARRLADGALQVVIVTEDHGHGGEYGFAYSERSLAPTPMRESRAWVMLDVPGRLTIARPDGRLDERWWRVLWNLD